VKVCGHLCRVAMCWKGNTIVAYCVARKSIIPLKDGELIFVDRWHCINYTSFSLIQER